jgi:hypothetical protein
MLRNAVECLTGIFVYQEIVDSSTKQWEKKYLTPLTPSHLPRGENISYHTAEVLRQAENSNVIEGGWVGGDAFFGSVESCVELKRVLGLYSTFIVKQNVNYFPMKVLHAVLVARHGSRPAGNWVVMKSTIGGVDLYVMAYAWSSKGVAYMVSTCGKTVMHEKAYISRFEDEYGNVQHKELARPTIAHMLYEFLPLIDEHNKARQNSLALEKCWLTKSCWVRIVTTLLGMSVVDLQRWDRNKRHGHVQHATEDDEIVDDFDIKVMANLIGKPLVDGTFRYYRTVKRPSARITTSTDTSNNPLTRIVGFDGSTNYPKKKDSDKSRVRQQSCFICRRYSPDHQNTQWKCKCCGMPLCQIDRTNKTTRKYSCVYEHKQSGFDAIRCLGVQKVGGFKMPEEMLVYKITRSEQQRRDDRREEKKRRREISKGNEPRSSTRRKRSK